MPVLDEPIDLLPELAPVAKRKKFSQFEIMTGAFFLFGIVMEGYATSEYAATFIVIPAAMLFGAYMFGFYWLEKPDSKNGVSVVLTILYGISFASIVISITSNVVGGDDDFEAGIVTIAFFTLVCITDYVLSIWFPRVANLNTAIRGGILVSALIGSAIIYG